jgi:hypothetical protein
MPWLIDVRIALTARYLSIDLGLLSAGSFLALRQRGVGLLKPSLGPLHCLQTPRDRVPAFLDTVAGGHAPAAMVFAEFVLPCVKLLFSGVGTGIPGIGDVVPLVSGLVPLVCLAFPLVGDVVPIIGDPGAIIQRLRAPLVVITVSAGTFRVYQTHASTLGHAARSSTAELVWA